MGHHIQMGKAAPGRGLLGERWKGFRWPAVPAYLVATAMLVAEAVLATSLLALAPEPANTRFFDDRFPFQNRRQRESFDWFEPAPLERPRERAAPQQERTPPDYSKAPAPKKVDPKAEAAVTTAIMVFGDSMADWLGYGLELAYAESPEIGILRKHPRTVTMPSQAPTLKVRPGGCAPAMECISPRPAPESSPTTWSVRSSAG
jgi:hypothetical protein